MNEVSIQTDILNKLIDKYERSKGFIEENIAGRKPALQPEKLFPNYRIDTLDYECFSVVNQAIEALEQNQFVFAKRKKSTIKTIELNVCAINSVYSFLDRTPKKEIYAGITKILKKYINSNEILHNFCTTQLEKINKNQKVEHYNNDEEFENILRAIQEILKVKEEMFVREFSVQNFSDSKYFEGIESKVKSILLHYGSFGDCVDEKNILKELHIIKNPSFVYFRGNGILTIQGKQIDLSVFDGGLGLSSVDFENIESVEIRASKVVTIENLTSYNLHEDTEAFIVYTGGFCNEAKLNFLRLLYKNNESKRFFHWSDIDAGGFLIFNHIKKETGINVKPVFMNIEYLEKYKNYCKPLTDNDKTRLQGLQVEEFSEVIKYMLQHNCKLEQEALSV